MINDGKESANIFLRDVMNGTFIKQALCACWKRGWNGAALWESNIDSEPKGIEGEAFPLWNEHPVDGGPTQRSRSENKKLCK